MSESGLGKIESFLGVSESGSGKIGGFGGMSDIGLSGDGIAACNDSTDLSDGACRREDWQRRIDGGLGGSGRGGHGLGVLIR